VSKKPQEVDLLEMGGVELETFGTGEVARLLDVEIWRVQKYLDSPKYQLSPSGKLGFGRGSRRVFTRQDLYRLAIANWMRRDGFDAAFIAHALQSLRDEEVLGVGEEEREIDYVLAVRRSGAGPVVEVKTEGRISQAPREKYYYVLRLREVIAEVAMRIKEQG
jgi:DNA-binding transcriptional MerR regulator